MWSVVIAFALLGAVYLVARISTPDPSGTYVPGPRPPAHARGHRVDPVPELARARASRVRLRGRVHRAQLAALLGRAAQRHLARRSTRRPGPTRCSSSPARRSSRSPPRPTSSARRSRPPRRSSTSPTSRSCCCCSPTRCPELTALFLPLAAWLIASRRGDWDQLLAATFVTVAVAVPTLLLSVSIEVFVFPHLIEAAVS